MSGIIMRGSDWVPLRGIDQAPAERGPPASPSWGTMARPAARAYVPPQPDDGHTKSRLGGALGGFTARIR